MACPACPSGWEVPEGAPGLCCQNAPNGAIECFSQAVSPSLAPQYTAPSSAPVGCSGSAAISIDGGTEIGGCSCNSTVSGHDYELDCPTGGGACTCFVDGSPSKQVSPGSGGCTSQASGTLFQQCGFPTQ
jgi:hypothetical protein